MSPVITLEGLARFLVKTKELISERASSTLSNVSVSNFLAKLMETKAQAIYTAESTDGVAYTVTIPNVTSLYAGLEIVITVSRVSASVSPTLNVNGLGAKTIRQPMTTNSSATAPATVATWLGKGYPIKLTYNGYMWKTDFFRPSASTIYGAVGVANGGTGGTTAEEARTNLSVPSLEQFNALVQRVSNLES